MSFANSVSRDLVAVEVDDWDVVGIEGEPLAVSGGGDIDFVDMAIAACSQFLDDEPCGVAERAVPFGEESNLVHLWGSMMALTISPVATRSRASLVAERG